jgi:hypothetical protein
MQQSRVVNILRLHCKQQQHNAKHQLLHKKKFKKVNNDDPKKIQHQQKYSHLKSKKTKSSI